MGNITKTQTIPPAYSLPTQAFETRLTLLASRLETHPGGRFSISDRFAPSEGDRRTLEDRRFEVARTLHAAGNAAIAGLVAAMMLGFGGARLSTEESKRTTALYVSQLARFPEWAIKAACEDAMRSGATFAPSVAELVKATEDHVFHASDELSRINRILNADVYHEPDEGERARIDAAFQELLKGLKLTEPFAVRARETEARIARDEKFIADLEAGRVMLPPMSPALRAKVGGAA